MWVCYLLLLSLLLLLLWISILRRSLGQVALLLIELLRELWWVVLVLVLRYILLERWELRVVLGIWSEYTLLDSSGRWQLWLLLLL